MTESPIASLTVAAVGYVVGAGVWAARVERRLAVLEAENGMLQTINAKLDDLLQRLSNLEGRYGANR